MGISGKFDDNVWYKDSFFGTLFLDKESLPKRNRENGERKWERRVRLFTNKVAAT